MQDFYWRVSDVSLVCNSIRKWTRAVRAQFSILLRLALTFPIFSLSNVLATRMRENRRSSPTPLSLSVYPRLTRISAYLETRFRDSRSQNRIFETIIERFFHRWNLLRKLT